MTMISNAPSFEVLRTGTGAAEESRPSPDAEEGMETWVVRTIVKDNIGM